jgi:hypothetical protein
METMLDRLPELYRVHVIDAGKQPQLLLLVAFLITFLAVRLITHAIRDGRHVRLLHNVNRRGVHIHHLVPGILLLLVTGYLFAALDPRHRDVLAMFFGIGAALTLDEFALWLDLRDVYWEHEGRRSIDAVVVFAAFAGIVLVGGRFFVEVAREFGRIF